jgi:RNA polymerase-binding transcription factor DksA
MSMSASSADNNDQTSIDAIEKDLADVEAALARLEAGTYWTDEVTGQLIPDEVLNRNPLARRKD